MTSEQPRHIIVIGAGIVGANRSELEGAEAIVPELPCIGLRPVHPGVVLAAIVGQLASGEIVDGQPASALEACRPARFLA